ncbi:MAG: CDP-diacylglycerol--glycerol-3-phosphate 3-phosphatidyltransferase [Terriglobia bacterium]|jgi:CDP-diacylglycerol--glycerol-3-phosphate 3-phosphatidyltransferase
MNLPIALTLSRIFLVPVVVVVLLASRFPIFPDLYAQYQEFIAVTLFLAAAITDSLDGYFARKRGQVTTLGILLDPIADKLLISAALVSLVKTVPWVPAWLVVLIIGREFVVSGLRNIASAEGFTIDASELGKIKMIMQVVAITLIIIGSKHKAFELLGRGALYLVGFFAVVSAVQYFRHFWGKVDGSIKERQRRRRSILLRRKMRRDVAAK